MTFDLRWSFPLFCSNVSNTRKDVSSDFQTPRSRLEKRGAAEIFFLPTSRCLEIEGNPLSSGKFKTRLDAFCHSYISPILFLSSFSWCQKFPIHEIFRSDVLWKLFDIGFPYKHCYFKRVCLLVKMASKTVIRPIEGGEGSMLFWPDSVPLKG